MDIGQANDVMDSLALMPDAALQQYAQMHKDDPYVMSLALSESNRRKKIRAAQQAQGGALRGVGRVLLDVHLDVVGDGVGRASRAGDQRLVEIDGVVHSHTVLLSVVERSTPATGAEARSWTTSNTGARSPTASSIARKKS